jgi:hypothetical protein
VERIRALVNQLDANSRLKHLDPSGKRRLVMLRRCAAAENVSPPTSSHRASVTTLRGIYAIYLSTPEKRHWRIANHKA